MLVNKNGSENDLANFVLSRSMKALSDLLEKTSKMGFTSKTVFYSKQICMEVVHEHSHRRCEDCYAVENG